MAPLRMPARAIRTVAVGAVGESMQLLEDFCSSNAACVAARTAHTTNYVHSA